MLEKMDDFFTARVEGYDEHMRSNIEGASAFYKYTAELLPESDGAKVLDLGCGTGLELEEYFKVNPSAAVTGIDLTEAMLNALKNKYPDKDLTLICGSYFEEPFGKNAYDAAVSVESLHHFKREKKLGLYRKLHEALKNDGYFVLTDYFAESEDLEVEYFHNLEEIKREEGLAEDEFYHYDTPLTVEHEAEVLKEAGFSKVEIMNRWESTCTILARK